MKVLEECSARGIRAAARHSLALQGRHSVGVRGAQGLTALPLVECSARGIRAAARHSFALQEFVENADVRHSA